MTCKVALLEIVKDLVQILKSEQRDEYTTKNASGFLGSLHCKQNEPTLLFANLSFPTVSSTSTKIAARDCGPNCFESSGNLLSLVSDPAANYNVDPSYPFGKLNEDMSVPPGMSEFASTPDEELDAIDKESRKLRAKLKLLEAKKKARTQQLQKRAPAYNAGYVYSPEEAKQSVGHEQKESFQSKTFATKTFASNAFIFETLEKTNSWTTNFLDNSDYVVV